MAIRRHIINERAKSEELPWPPSADFLKSDSLTPPDSLINFLELVLTGKTKKTSTGASEKTSRLATSITEDVCVAVIHGAWKMREHLLLGLSVHHVTRSAQLVTLLNRFGHSCSYSQVLELEAAMEDQVECRDSVLPFNIALTDIVVCHKCWDNFDMTEETPSGFSTTHSTHGISIQEVTSDHTVLVEETHLPRRKTKSNNSVPSALPPCYSKKRVEPVSSNCFSVFFPGLTRINYSFKMSANELLWTLCRAACNDEFTIPDWAGWVSMTAEHQKRTQQSTIGYMRPVLHPITEKATVQYCIRTSVEACAKLNQKFTFITMDLAAAKIAYDIKWNDPDEFQNVFTCMGSLPHQLLLYESPRSNDGR